MATDESPQQWDTDRVLTIPNVISFFRLLAIPLFGWLIVAGEDLWAVLVLIIFGATDWLDGFLARRLKQRTELGARLDPVADRFYILVAILALFLQGIVPWWLPVILVLRDVMLVVLLPFLRRTGRIGLPVTWVGKAGTFFLLFAFPTMLLGSPDGLAVPALWPLGWTFAIVGAVLYWTAGIGYVRETVSLTRSNRRMVDGAP